jgi:hypothetical protein
MAVRPRIRAEHIREMLTKIKDHDMIPPYWYTTDPAATDYLTNMNNQQFETLKRTLNEDIKQHRSKEIREMLTKIKDHDMIPPYWYTSDSAATDYLTNMNNQQFGTLKRTLNEDKQHRSYDTVPSSFYAVKPGFRVLNGHKGLNGGSKKVTSIRKSKVMGRKRNTTKKKKRIFSKKSRRKVSARKKRLIRKNKGKKKLMGGAAPAGSGLPSKDLPPGESLRRAAYAAQSWVEVPGHTDIMYNRALNKVRTYASPHIVYTLYFDKGDDYEPPDTTIIGTTTTLQDVYKAFPSQQSSNVTESTGVDSDNKYPQHLKGMSDSGASAFTMGPVLSK